MSAVPTGSGSPMNTMGIERLAVLAASALPVGAVTRTSTFSRTSSAASGESRST